MLLLLQSATLISVDSAKKHSYGNYARTLKASHGSLGRAMDLIPKPRTLKKVQLRDISWNLTPPTPAHGPRGHFIKAFFTPQYSRENVGISRIDLHCQKPLNSLNLMVFLKFSISHCKWSKFAVKSGRFWDRGRLAGVWRSSVWQGFSATVFENTKSFSKLPYSPLLSPLMV